MVPLETGGHGAQLEAKHREDSKCLLEMVLLEQVRLTTYKSYSGDVKPSWTQVQELSAGHVGFCPIRVPLALSV